MKNARLGTQTPISSFLEARPHLLTVSPTDGKLDRTAQEKLLVEASDDSLDLAAFSGGNSTPLTYCRVSDLIHDGTYRQIIPGRLLNFFANAKQAFQVVQDNPERLNEVSKEYRLHIPFVAADGRKFVRRIFCRGNGGIVGRTRQFIDDYIWSVEAKNVFILPV